MGAEIAQLIEEGITIRDRHTGVRRAIGPGDIGVLFRTGKVTVSLKRRWLDARCPSTRAWASSMPRK